ncbi:glycosyltransferase involved in cell wall biosynthesis [Natrinema hispanicum]|uniref:Glycosyltransferase involved in cell wall biosynthesis n=2 Tax=Natrinema hispanicum TaxID=392421 RepID=A0A482Y831_9EURY|nr:glycosyltransferase involved in cell wall biosynthesis [Natrinema hispanicum]
MTEHPRIMGFADDRSSKISEPLSFLENSEVITISDRDGMSKYPYLFRKGSKCIDKNQPDVLLSNYPGRLGATVLTLGQVKDIPVVIRVGGDMWKTNYEELRQNLRDQNFLSAVARVGQIGINEVFGSNADGYLVVSTELQQLVANRTGLPSKRVKRVSVPIDSASYRDGDPVSGRELIGQEAERIILTVTNLRFKGKVKGIYYLLQELEPLLRVNPDITYVIAGGGQYLDDLRQYVNRIVPETIRDQIIIAGFVPNVADLYAAASVFVYCSHIDGCPNVVSEAMAAGLPVVANADHGMIEQITHEETGLLVDADTQGEFTRAVAQVLSNNSLADQFGSNAQQCVSVRNDSKRIAQEMGVAIEEILDSIESTS